MHNKTGEDSSAGGSQSSYNEVNIGPLIFGFFLLIFLALVFVRFAPSTPAIIAFLVGLGAALGYAAGGCPLHLSDTWVVRQCHLHEEDLQGFGRTFQRQEGRFLSFSSALAAGYVAFYWFAASKISGSTDGETVSWVVVAIAVITIGAFGYASARYAAYIRIANLLSAAVDQSQVSAQVIRNLRQAVIRREQLFEPPGNLFVTLGITATFLGLAVGLVMIDLSQLFPAQGVTPAAAAARGPATVASLGAFVGCMGLALGMSMLGVLTAMAAQWLRGYGPAESTEELLRRAQDRLLPPNAATPAPAAAPAPAPAPAPAGK